MSRADDRGRPGPPRSTRSGWRRPPRRRGSPAPALRAYARAQLADAGGCGVGWTTLAGMGWVESYHGTIGGRTLGADGRSSSPIVGPALDGHGDFAAIRSTPASRAWHGDPVWEHAVGPMQFLPGTWTSWATDGDGDGRRDPLDLDDAAATAARYLCAGEHDLLLRLRLGGRDPQLQPRPRPTWTTCTPPRWSTPKPAEPCRPPRLGISCTLPRWGLIAALDLTREGSPVLGLPPSARPCLVAGWECTRRPCSRTASGFTAGSTQNWPGTAGASAGVSTWSRAQPPGWRCWTQIFPGVQASCAVPRLALRGPLAGRRRTGGLTPPPWWHGGTPGDWESCGR